MASNSMDIDFKEYQLRCQLRGHEDDARGICICGNAGIATSSRDRTVRFWTLDESQKRDYTMSKILLGHTSFVGPLAWIPPNEDFPEGGIMSGGMDTLLLVWNLMTGEKVHTLKGHKLQVTGIALDGSDVVSSSVDCTLRRWRGSQQVEEWEAHKAAIQAVIKLPSGELVTGSSDMTLKLWKGKSCIHTFQGHTDTVRGVAIMPNLGILSASHDGTIRLWALSGELLMEMVGHTSIVYSVDAHASGLIVSASEDCSAKIWKDGICVQSIEHPGCVWDAKFLENGDIVTACSDGIVRIWTVDHERTADTVELDSFASQISQYKLSRKRVGGLKLEELPGLDSLKTPGSSDGQTKVVREGDNGVAYAWNMREQKWDKIGEVVDGPDDNMKSSVLNGVQYDHVFDVDIGDGEPIRKLPYNRSENPYDVADKWLLNENLPLSYRQQIVEFILQNTGQKNFTPDPLFRDPYTGSNAYVPGAPSKFPDASSSKPSYKHIPKRGMLAFDTAQFDGILKKISEFNSSLLSDPEKKHLSLSDSDVSRFNAIVKILKDTSHYHSSRFADVDVALMLKVLKTWPVALLFPVIDVVRMIVLHPDGAAKLMQHVKDQDDIVIEVIKKVLDALSCCCSSSNKNVQLSYATLILNYAVLLIEKKDEEGQSQVLSAALEMAEGETIDSDSRFRAMVAIGSLMLEGLVRRVALDFDVLTIAKTAKSSKEAKIAEIGADIELVAKQS
ncbi:phospholipase A-2-activating protein isoform X2 [Salvia hispanica]|uniref:phospholipase A-2-activating protein isoform X2 n=1 Tax=Salvia hispanica TaxID=49212 RepID=UPI002009C26B|nr:phospholipase A-2-activating protein isoform X2 [Salvia hispanica]